MQRKPKGPGLSEELSRRRLLQLGAAGAALLGAGRASAAPAGSPDAGTGQGGSLDEVGLDELQARMASGEETAPLAHREVPRPHRARAGRPALPFGASRSTRTRCAIADALDAERKAARAARAAARHPGAHQGQHRHRATGCRPPPARWRSWARRRRATPSWSSGCARPARCCSARRTSASGPTSARRTRRAAGAGAAGSAATPTRSTATRRGSSSGSGAAVAASLCAVGVGTETDGSIVSPVGGQRRSSGIKPTRGPGQPQRASSRSRTPGHRRPDGAHRRRRRDPARRRSPASTRATRRPPRAAAAAAPTTRSASTRTG